MKPENFGIVYVMISSRNIIINFMNNNGKILCGTTIPAIKHEHDELGIEAKTSISRLVNLVKQYGINHVNVHFKGTNRGLSEVVQEIKSLGINVESIKDLNTIPHNACRPLRKNK